MSATRVTRWWARVLSAAFFPLVVLGLSGTDGLDAQQKASEDFKKLCASCHGAAGLGDGPAAVALRPPPASFADSTFQATHTDEEIIAVIAAGKPPMMPGFSKQLSPEQIKALAAYIRELGKTPE